MQWTQRLYFTPGPTTPICQSCTSSPPSLAPLNSRRAHSGPKGACPAKAVPAQPPAPSVSGLRFPSPDLLVRPHISFPSAQPSLLFQLRISGLRLLPPGSLQELNQSLPEQGQGDRCWGSSYSGEPRQSRSWREAGGEEQSRAERTSTALRAPQPPRRPGPPQCPRQPLRPPPTAPLEWGR